MVVFLVACGSPAPQPSESAQPLPTPSRTEPTPTTATATAPPMVEIGKATLDLKTPGAKVELVAGADRRVVPQFPISINIKTSVEWTIIATKPGYRDYVQPIRFDDAPEKTFVIELVPR